jgi:hypothetical protein
MESLFAAGLNGLLQQNPPRADISNASGADIHLEDSASRIPLGQDRLAGCIVQVQTYGEFHACRRVLAGCLATIVTLFPRLKWRRSAARSIWVRISATGDQPMSSTDALTHRAQSRPKSGSAMMRMTIAVAALIVVVTAMLRSRSSSIELSTAAKPPPLQELHPMLPTEFGSLNF